MSIGFPTAPLAFRLRGAGGGAVENPQPVQHLHYLSEIPVQLLPTSAVSLIARRSCRRSVTSIPTITRITRSKHKGSCRR